MKVLLAIDGLSFSDSVIRAATERPWPAGTSFHVVCVVDTYAMAEIATLISEATETARNTVENAAQQIQSAGFPVSTKIGEGYPSTCVVSEAKKVGADFVFVGSHGNRAVTRFLLGSTAHAVVRNAPCPVEIVRSGPKHLRVNPRNRKTEGDRGMRILLATDGSECSLVAARSIADRPWPAGTEVRIICACDFYVPVVDLQTSNPEVWEDLRNACVTQADLAVTAASKILDNAQIKVRGCVPSILAGAKAVVLDEAIGWDADLLVVGSHGRRGFDRMLLGSFSEVIAMNAHCSVEVIRRKI